MRLTIASGKGGTGKTTVATSLALALARRDRGVIYVDCDVEAPNGHLFLRPEISTTEPVLVQRPEVLADRCTSCGACGKICQFSAILCLGGTAQVFGQLCHSCGGCVRVCPAGAIQERSSPLGVVRKGRAGDLAFLEGRLNVGEAMATPVVREVKRQIPQGGIQILDAPPGTGCPVVETLRGSDYVLLVADSTPFSLYDLELSVALLRVMDLPFGVVVNRSDGKDEPLVALAERENFPIHLTIPADRRVAVAYSEGTPAIVPLPDLAGRLCEMFDHIGKARKP